MTALAVPDLWDTGGCPDRGSCEVCGGETDLRTVTVLSNQGVFCRWLCWRCADGGHGRLRDDTWTLEAVRQHCEHLGVTHGRMLAEVFDDDWDT